jgi:hypothetical protein
VRVYRDVIVGVAEAFTRETQGAKVSTKGMMQDAEDIITFETRMAEVSTIQCSRAKKLKRKK